MQFDILDNNVSTSMNVFIIIANVLNLFYNIPQMCTTYKRKSTKDISPTFLLLRFVSNNIWIVYAIEINSVLFLINNVVTVIATAFIGYYKICELLLESKIKNNIIEDEIENISV